MLWCWIITFSFRKTDTTTTGSTAFSPISKSTPSAVNCERPFTNFNTFGIVTPLDYLNDFKILITRWPITKFSFVLYVAVLSLSGNSLQHIFATIRHGSNRIKQVLIHNPGSTMKFQKNLTRNGGYLKSNLPALSQ